MSKIACEVDICSARSKEGLVKWLYILLDNNNYKVVKSVAM